MGSTCYMSVIIQSFVRVPALRDYSLTYGHNPQHVLEQNCMTCAMETLVKEFYGQDEKTGYTAQDFLSASWGCQQADAKFSHLSGDKQQDAHEFFQFLTEVLHESARPENGKDDITDRCKMRRSQDFLRTNPAKHDVL